MDIGHSTSASPFLNQTMDSDISEQLHPSKRLKPSAPSPDLISRDATQSTDSKRKLSVSTHDVVEDLGDPSLMGDQDPFEFDENMTEYYLHHYFTKINYTTYCMFPKTAFMKWVRTCREKSSWDKMLVYAMMAHGTIFATNARKHVDGEIFSRIAHRAIGESSGEFKLQVVQTRLILALYDFSRGSTAKAWDFTGSAVRSACGMKLNIEEGVIDIKDDETLVYGLDKPTLIECRRRTFWSAYIMDRFNGFCSGHLAMFHNEDCLLRLPCNEKMYEAGHIPLTPFFDNRIIDSQQFVYGDSNDPGMMAYLVQIASIWGEVLARAYRSRYQQPEAWGVPFEEFYQQTTKRLEAWERSLGAHLRCSPGNIDKAGQSGHLGTYGALHTLYHSTMMKLNRHARYDRMQRQHVDRNVKCAYDHACKTLDMMKAITRQNKSGRGGNFGFAVSSPFTGFAILTAVDIITATGSMADLMSENSRSIELLAGGIEVMTELSEHWSSAKTQLKLIADRFDNLMATTQSSHGLPERTRVTSFFAKDPLETTLGLEHDLVYALPKKRYLEALGWGSLIREGDEMLEVLKRGSSVNIEPLCKTSILDN
jgi:Fungal specific transcription factor domain